MALTNQHLPFTISVAATHTHTRQRKQWGRKTTAQQRRRTNSEQLLFTR